MEEKKEQKVPGRETWPKLSIGEMYEVKSELYNMYYAAQRAGVSYGEQYLKLISYADAVILQKIAEQEQQRDEQ
jgi:hypothetical protein